MNVKINETDEVKELSIIDRKSGINWVRDLIGTAGAMNDGQFTWSEDDGAYLATQETYDWWAKYIEDSETTEREAEALAEELGMSFDDVMYRIQADADSDYEAHRRSAIFTMQQIRDDHRESA